MQARFESEFNRLENVINEKDSEIRKLENKIEANKVKVDELEKKNTIKENKIEEILEQIIQVNEKVKTIETVNDIKTEALEAKLNAQNKAFTEQCCKVLAVKVDEICLGEGTTEVENAIIDFFDNEHENQEETNNLDDTFLNPSISFSCIKCDFVAKNAGGLKTHIKKKHKNYD